VEGFWDGAWLPALAAVLLLAAVFRRPVKWLLGLAGRSLLWLGGLFLLESVGAGVLGVNCFNALALGLLGLPGAGLLLGLRWLA
jgi:hypothetical protein